MGSTWEVNTEAIASGVEAEGHGLKQPGGYRTCHYIGTTFPIGKYAIDAEGGCGSN